MSRVVFTAIACVRLHRSEENARRGCELWFRKARGVVGITRSEPLHRPVGGAAPSRAPVQILEDLQAAELNFLHTSGRCVLNSALLKLFFIKNIFL